MIRTISLCASAVLVVALLIAPAAEASLPKTSDKTIVPGVSIGGISLKTKTKKAKKKWKGGACGSSDGYSYCNFTTKKTTAGSASFGGSKKVQFVNIYAGYDTVKQKTVFKGSIKKFKTAEGIGIGSKLSKVKKISGAKKVADNAYQVKGSKKSYMFFMGDPSGKVSGISLSTGQGG